MCYPEDSAKTEEKVHLQLLLNRTYKRILKMNTDKIFFLIDEHLYNSNLMSKWECDGSSQDEYKQKFSGANFSDASVFIISFVQLEMNGYILW